MLSGKFLVSLCAFCVVSCDLLDLYVQHMDDTMRTVSHERSHHPRDLAGKVRANRGASRNADPFRIGILRRQRLEVDESHWRRSKAKKDTRKKRPIVKHDGLEFPNDREEHRGPDEHELLEKTFVNEAKNATKEYDKFVRDFGAKIVKKVDGKKHKIINEEVRTVGKHESFASESESEGKKLRRENDEFFRDLGAKIVKNVDGKKLKIINEEDRSPDEHESFESEGIKLRRENGEFARDGDGKIVEEIGEPLAEIIDVNAESKRIERRRFEEPVIKRNPNRWNSPPKKYYPPVQKHPSEGKKSPRTDKVNEDLTVDAINGRSKRNAAVANFTRHEVLDDAGDVLLQWDPNNDETVTFKVTAKTLGYVGIGFNDQSHMKGADILIAWVDDHTGAVNLLDSHGIEEANASPVTDLSQDVTVLEGFQNDTHTSVTFSRSWQTCDPEDRQLSADNVRVLWALHESDPELNTGVWHGERRGGRALRLRAPGPKPSPPVGPDVRHWDVKLNQFAVTESQDTVYWCKIFKAPPLKKKHHMIGYEPLVEKGNRGLVHHMILYECASTLPILGQHARLAGAPCYGATMPREWDSCMQPVVAWARGSRGEWFSEDVGIPIAEHSEGSYYMLEVHYNNPGMKHAIDSSGVRLHITPNLRPKEAGILVTGVAVNPLHMIPPRQKEYATAGYCTGSCTNTLFPEDGVNAVSVVLHSHLAGRRMSLKHVRQGKELPHIVSENNFDFDYQQSHTLEEEVKIMPGDELITECVYSTQDRETPTLGGYAATQEMCLAFIVYYPRTELAGCYSIIPAKDLFRTLGVHSFKGVTMEHLEKLFFTVGTESIALPTSLQQLASYPEVEKNDELDEKIIKETESALRAMRDYSEDRNTDNVFARLIIEDPEEFRSRTLAQHMLELPWSEELLARSIESTLYHGRHMTFCRKRDDKLALPADIQMFPNFTALPVADPSNCTNLRHTSGSQWTTVHQALIPLVVFILSLWML